MLKATLTTIVAFSRLGTPLSPAYSACFSGDYAMYAISEGSSPLPPPPLLTWFKNGKKFFFVKKHCSKSAGPVVLVNPVKKDHGNHKNVPSELFWIILN